MAVATPCCPRAGFGDDAFLAHAPGEQGLPEAVIDLVRSGMEQVFALEIDLRAAEPFREAAGVVQRSRAAGVVGEQSGQLRLKRGVAARFQIGVLKFFDGRHQDFRHKSPPVGTEVTAGIRLRRHTPSAALAAIMNSVIFL